MLLLTEGQVSDYKGAAIILPAMPQAPCSSPSAVKTPTSICPRCATSRLRDRVDDRLPDAELVAHIRALVAELPTYGYRRVHALLRRQAQETGRAVPPPAFQRCFASPEPWQAPPNPKRVYRVIKVHGLLLQRDGEQRE